MVYLKRDHLGIVHVVQPEVVNFRDVPQIAAYHNKELFLLHLCLKLSQTCDVAQSGLLNLSVDLLHS